MPTQANNGTQGTISWWLFMALREKACKVLSSIDVYSWSKSTVIQLQELHMPTGGRRKTVALLLRIECETVSVFWATYASLLLPSFIPWGKKGDVHLSLRLLNKSCCLISLLVIVPLSLLPHNILLPLTPDVTRLLPHGSNRSDYNVK